MRWNLDPMLLLLLCAALWAVSRLDRSRRLPLFLALALGAFLYVSPFCALGSALFSARVVHHLLLVIGMAPLVAWGARGLRPWGSIGLWTAAQALVLWFWHWPEAYAAALSESAVFWLMQGSLLLASAGFWHRLQAARPAAAIPALLATMMQMSLLGALIAFAGAPLYRPHWLTTAAWGMGPLADQQLAGLLMWIPAGTVYLALVLRLARRMLVPAYDGLGRSV